MGGSLSEKRQHSGASGLLDTLNMETVRTILAHPYPYPHEHSRHAVIAVVVGCLFFISSDNMHTLIHKLDSNLKWWSMYGCLPGFFYFFSSPFFGKTIKPSYSNFSRCHCGNRAIMEDKTFKRRNSSWFKLWDKEERNTWIAQFIRMNELKDQVCSSWFAPVGSASNYPLLSKWVIYGEIACDGPCPGSSDGISPIYSLWATFIGLYIANYVVERSTGWALTHSLPEEYENLKKRQMKLDFLDMVLWYSGTSADLLRQSLTYWYR